MSFMRSLKFLLSGHSAMKYVAAPSAIRLNSGGSVCASVGALGSISVLAICTIMAMIVAAVRYGIAAVILGFWVAYLWVSLL